MSMLRSIALGLLIAQSGGMSLLMAATAPPAASPATPSATPQAPQQAPQPARLPDGKPNWTGFWTPRGGIMDRNFGPGATASAPRPAGAQVQASISSPLKSPYKEKYEAMRKASAEGTVIYDPSGLCIPSGMPRMMGGIYGLEILQTPGQVTITSEFGMVSRRIWTDGRKHPPLDELLPTYTGHSIGHWEGDVLVVDTIGIRSDVLIEQSGLPLSEQMRITERFYQLEPGILADDITLDDPTVYTAPWKQERRYRFRPELNLQEFVCLENNRNVGDNGEPVFK
jgi:hypothetical protein